MKVAKRVGVLRLSNEARTWQNEGSLGCLSLCVRLVHSKEIVFTVLLCCQSCWNLEQYACLDQQSKMHCIECPPCLRWLALLSTGQIYNAHPRRSTRSNTISDMEAIQPSTSDPMEGTKSTAPPTQKSDNGPKTPNRTVYVVCELHEPDSTETDVLTWHGKYKESASRTKIRSYANMLIATAPLAAFEDLDDANEYAAKHVRTLEEITKKGNTSHSPASSSSDESFDWEFADEHRSDAEWMKVLHKRLAGSHDVTHEPDVHADGTKLWRVEWQNLSRGGESWTEVMVEKLDIVGKGEQAVEVWPLMPCVGFPRRKERAKE